ncbi:MAG TPA: shikimate dehydrogenase [Allosphingosinicella sp.]|nr:shikimate dehydrogenase [Allosphingosinicella sp.]
MGVPYAEVIGDPIAHSKSPLIHKFWLGRLGLEGDYRATRVAPQDIASYLSNRRADPDWRGCSVTMPLKRLVEPHLDHLDPSSEWAGSTNCIFWDDPQTLAGCNTDSSGVGTALIEANLRFKAAAVIGSGAAAQCALWTLREEEIAHVRFVARNAQEAARLLSFMNLPGEIYSVEEAAEAFSGASAIINASPLGMNGFAKMPVEILAGVRHSRIDSTVFDMVYDPVVTELLVEAARMGRKVADGLDMLVAQARDSFHHFYRGDHAGIDFAWDGELRELLTR